MQNALALILAGGKGTRLLPLTLHRAKPAVPFGGQYRIMGKEILRLISPELEKQSEDVYMKIKKRAVDVINKSFGIGEVVS